jgi:lipocalin
MTNYFLSEDLQSRLITYLNEEELSYILFWGLFDRDIQSSIEYILNNHKTNPILLNAEKKFYLNMIKNTSTIQAKPVTELNLKMYMGRWYEVYQDSFTAQTFQAGGICAIADYSIDEKHNSINVRNSQIVNGNFDYIMGKAYYKDGAKGGDLTIFLQGPNMEASYWIIALGEIKNAQYQWAIVSGPGMRSLFVLTRNVDEFNFSYKNVILNTLMKFGFFTEQNLPVIMPHYKECSYLQQ